MTQGFPELSETLGPSKYQFPRVPIIGAMSAFPVACSLASGKEAVAVDVGEGCRSEVLRSEFGSGNCKSSGGPSSGVSEGGGQEVFGSVCRRKGNIDNCKFPGDSSDGAVGWWFWCSVSGWAWEGRPQ